MIVHGPGDFALTLNLQTFGDAFELRDFSRWSDRAMKVGKVGSDRDTGARVPDDWTCVCGGTKRIAHARRSLESHAKRRRMTCKVDVGEDFVGGGTLTNGEWREGERIWRVGGCHRAILGVARGLARRLTNPVRLLTPVGLSLLACGRW